MTDAVSEVRRLRAEAAEAVADGRLVEARSFHAEAVEWSRRTGDPLLIAHTVRHMGDPLRRVDELTDAERCYTEALELYRAEPNPPPGDLANALRPMAILQEQLGRTTESRALWVEARGLYEHLGIEAGIAECDVALERLGR